MSSTSYPLFFQALQKIQLINHIKSMAELLHADTIQQLGVALLGSPVTQLLNILATRMMHTASTRQAIHPTQAYTMTFMVPPPSTIPIVGITDCSMPCCSFQQQQSTNTSLSRNSRNSTKTLLDLPNTDSPA